MAVELYDHQSEAIEKMHNGCILCGGVGTGKSRTSLGYFYFKECKGQMKVNGKGSFKPMEDPKNLYIITTAKKRDSGEWEDECAVYGLISGQPELSAGGIEIHIDSWNNIGKYKDVKDSFFIFDEQRVVGYGSWVKSFLAITKKNRWILLSATPGDTWSDYIPVFVANGFYRNKTDFSRQHIIYSRFTKYPKIEKYVDCGRLISYRNKILVMMHFDRSTIPKNIVVPVNYNKSIYDMVWKNRWDIYKDEPVKDAGGLCYILRRIVNSDPSRLVAIDKILNEHPRCIIFYNFDYELDALRELCDLRKVTYAEWNGKKHQEVPKGDNWVYLVQYTAGAEGWNCITTNVIIFYSQNYSYRMMTQAAGRIDRLNTKYQYLYYYHLRSSSHIDAAIYKAISMKKNFNESSFVGA